MKSRFPGLFYIQSNNDSIHPLLDEHLMDLVLLTQATL